MPRSFRIADTLHNGIHTFLASPVTCVRTQNRHEFPPPIPDTSSRHDRAGTPHEKIIIPSFASLPHPGHRPDFLYPVMIISPHITEKYLKIAGFYRKIVRIIMKTPYIHSPNLNGDTGFPYLVLDVVNDNAVPRNPGFQVMHWHEDLQFICVPDGEITLQTLEETVEIPRGNGIFINKNVVHHVRRKGTCHYNSFLFPEYFLTFHPATPAKDFVTGIVENPEIPYCLLDRKTGWGRQILEKLETLSWLEKNRDAFHVYQVLVLLASLWLDLLKNIGIPAKKPHNPVASRMKRFLEYIENHYATAITLDELAKSAHVSKSECLRCFRASLDTTPHQYLLEYRLSKACALLRHTDEPVTGISQKTGFGQTSHFGKCFREKTGLSPSNYRKQSRNGSMPP